MSRTCPAAGTGTGQATRATPDGYTALVTVNNIVINPPLFEKVPYDPRRQHQGAAVVGRPEP